VRRERVRSLLCHLPMDPARLAATLDGLRDEVLDDLAGDHVPEADRCVDYEAEMRFAGQRWEQTVSLPAAPTRDDGAELEAIFRREYLRRFGSAAKESSGTVELVALRAVGIGRMAAGPSFGGRGADVTARQATPSGQRPLHFERLAPARLIDVYDGHALAAGDIVAGPALIDGADTTIWIPSGAKAHLDANRTLIAEIMA
jgi:N-methylhydantoinase A